MWADAAVIYHLYALGACGAPQRNSGRNAPGQRLLRLVAELDRLAELGVDTLLVGPVFESMSHGYDTIDYLTLDRRLGDNATLEVLAKEVAAHGMRLVLDAVLNHVGRQFWAFEDVLANGPNSRFRDWFHIDFSRGNARGDGFSYKGWHGSTALVNLDLDNPEVRAYLLAVVTEWVDRFGVSGLRLDAANVMSRGFLHELAEHTKAIDPEFWMFGEIVEGDYRELLGPGMLDSVTNYWAYHSLWTSHRQRNYFEIADCLNRQFGLDGVYAGLSLVNFADNHDVDRVASKVQEPAQLYPLYGILLTMPGVPALYYGSEWGARGQLAGGRDRTLRPALDKLNREEPDLAGAIARMIRVRRLLPALDRGGYRQVHVSHGQLVFCRTLAAQSVTVAVNGDSGWARVPVGFPGRVYDQLAGESVDASDGHCWVPPYWLRILTQA